MTPVSVVIRAYDEAGPLGQLLELLRVQEYAGKVEIIVVDNGSTDATPEVASSYGARVVRLEQAEFSYPKSLNVGVAAATSPIVICTVAHAYPPNRHWIEAAVRHFDDPALAGVYSYVMANAKGTLFDKLGALTYWSTKPFGPKRTRRVRIGVFGATNIALRWSLWALHNFDENYGAGGEDTAWAKWATSSGYAIVRDPAFAVRHSHDLRTPRQAWRQLRLWRSLDRPRPFNRDEIGFRPRSSAKQGKMLK